jgi:hypothetical protein
MKTRRGDSMMASCRKSLVPEQASANRFADWLALTASKVEATTKKYKIGKQQASLDSSLKLNCCPRTFTSITDGN